LSVDDRGNGIANIHLAIGSEEVSQSPPLEFRVDVFTNIKPQPSRISHVV
jgi:hypothetical protein